MADIDKLTDKVDKLTNSITELVKEINGKSQKGNKNKNTNSDDEEEKEDKLKKLFDTIEDRFGRMKGIVSGVFNSLDEAQKHVADTWGKAEHGASSYAKSVGMSVQGMKELRDRTIDFVHESQLGVKYNTSMTELLKMQETYANSIGRSIQFTNTQLEKMAALKSVIGEEKTIKFTANFERFGLDSDAAIRDVEKMMAGATKRGLSFKKISDEFLNNMDLAQRFTFKNGLDGLRAMAEQAASLKWDMSQTASFANKVGTLEGSIKAGANLSVLGGAFSTMSNPLQMLYEGLNDMEGLNNRVTGMFANMAHYNESTKQVEVSAFNRLRIKSAAEAMGMDYGKVMESVFAQGRRGEIDRQLNGVTGLDDDMKEIIRNKALIDRKNGMAYLTLNGEKKYVSHLKDSDKRALKGLANTQEEDIKNTAINTRSIKDILEGTDKDKETWWANFYKETGIGERTKTMSVDIAKAKNILSMVGTVLGGIATTTAMILTAINFKGMMANRGALPGGASGSRGVSGGTVGRIGGGGGGTPSGGGGSAGGPVSIVGRNGRNEYITMSDGTKFRNMGQAQSYIQKQARLAESQARWAARRDALLAQKMQRQSLARNLGTGGIMLAGVVGGMAMSGAAEHQRAKGTYGAREAAAGWDWGSSILTGATMGATVGGVYGAAIGAVGGAIYGGINFANEKSKIAGERQRDNLIKAAKHRLRLRGIYLNGKDYTPEELDRIESNNFEDRALREKMQVNGDSEYIRYANGGLITGPSHALGGVHLEAEGGEFIVNKNATSMYYDQIKAMNDSTLGSKNKFSDGGIVGGIKAEEPLGKQMKVNEVKASTPSAEIEDINVSPIDVNINGNIRLEGNGSSKEINAKELLDNPEFIRHIRDILTKEINLIEHKRFDKAQHWRKM